MEYSGCKPFVDEVIEESTKEFGAAYVLQPKVRDRLYAACELVDEIVPELIPLMSVSTHPTSSSPSWLSVMIWCWNTEERTSSSSSSRWSTHSHFPSVEKNL